MNTLMRFFWIIDSFGPFGIVCGIGLLIDFFGEQKITNHWYSGAVVLAFSFLLIPVCFLLIEKSKNKLQKESIAIDSASNKADGIFLSALSYLIPLITLSFSDVNLWILLAEIVIILALLFITRALLNNIFVYLFHYRYYEVQAESGMTYSLLTKSEGFRPKGNHNVVKLFDGLYLEVTNDK